MIWSLIIYYYISNTGVSIVPSPDSPQPHTKTLMTNFTAYGWKKKIFNLLSEASFGGNWTKCFLRLVCITFILWLNLRVFLILGLPGVFFFQNQPSILRWQSSWQVYFQIPVWKHHLTSLQLISHVQHPCYFQQYMGLHLLSLDWNIKNSAEFPQQTGRSWGYTNLSQ